MKTQILIPAMALLLFAACKKESPILPNPVKVVPVKHDTIPTIKKDTIPIIIMPDTAYFRLQVKSLIHTTYSDDDLIIFDKSSSSKYVPGEDAPKFAGFGDLSLAVKTSDGYDMSIDYTPFKQGMVIGIDVTAQADNDCTLAITAFHKIPSKLHFWLKDNLKKDSTDLAVKAYSFSIKKADTTTFGANRFKIVIR